MGVYRLHEWCIDRQSAGVCGEEAVREAIARRSATLSLGPHRFLYTDEALSDGGHLLRLAPLRSEGEADVLDGYVAEQRVPPGLDHWNADTNARLVRVMGIALFRDVAKLASQLESSVSSPTVLREPASTHKRPS